MQSSIRLRGFIGIFLAACLSLFLLVPAFAQDKDEESGGPPPLDLVPTELGKQAGYQTQDVSLTLTVAKILRGFFVILGILAVVLITYAGFLWMTASGEEEKVGKAKRILIQAVIGLAIIMMAFSIAHFVVGALQEATVEEQAPLKPLFG